MEQIQYHFEIEVSQDAKAGQYVVTLIEPGDNRELRRFSTEDEANTYVNRLQAAIQGAINRTT